MHRAWLEVPLKEGFTRVEMTDALKRLHEMGELDMAQPPTNQVVEDLERGLARATREQVEAEREFRRLLPEYAGDTGFNEVVRFMLKDPTKDEMRSHETVHDLVRSRVVIVGRDQMNALPFADVGGDELVAWGSKPLGLPFDYCFLDLGYSDLRQGTVVAGGHEVGKAALFTPNYYFTFCYCRGKAKPLYGRHYDHSPGHRMKWLADPSALTDLDTGTEFNRGELIIGGFTERLYSACTLLECTNVELDQVALPRQQRRQAERKKLRIPLTIYVKQSHRKAPSGNHVGEANYSHRFEVRGHFKHFGPDTRLYQKSVPEKRILVEGHGRCVRLWCPPFVKGPEDKPLIPKRRILT